MTDRDSTTLADHAEAWHKEQGKPVPCRDTKAWQEMYEEWVNWAFADFGKKGKDSNEGD